MDNNLRQMIGQKFIFGIDQNISDDEIKLLIEKYKIGGFIIYRKNYTDYQSMLNFIKKLKSYNKTNEIPLFIGIDQEGGRVNRIPYEIKNTSRAFTLAKTKNIDIITKSASFTSDVLYNSGINLNFAPVLDIKRYDCNHYIGDRSFGENYKDVIKYGIPYFEELNKNILSCIKHFPGQGVVKNDSHYFLPCVNSFHLFNNDIKPFAEAIKHGCDAIMVGHILIKDINPKIPIAFDKNFLNEMRKKYKYNGLFISDELKMNAIKLRYSISGLIKKSFNNGLDVILMKYRHSDLKKLDKLYELYTNNRYNMDSLITSYNRIIKIKEKYKIDDNISFKGINVKKYNNDLDCFRNSFE